MYSSLDGTTVRSRLLSRRFCASFVLCVVLALFVVFVVAASNNGNHDNSALQQQQDVQQEQLGLTPATTTTTTKKHKKSTHPPTKHESKHAKEARLKREHDERRRREREKHEKLRKDRVKEEKQLRKQKEEEEKQLQLKQQQQQEEEEMAKKKQQQLLMEEESSSSSHDLEEAEEEEGAYAEEEEASVVDDDDDDSDQPTVVVDDDEEPIVDDNEPIVDDNEPAVDDNDNTIDTDYSEEEEGEDETTTTTLAPSTAAAAAVTTLSPSSSPPTPITEKKTNNDNNDNDDDYGTLPAAAASEVTCQDNSKCGVVGGEQVQVVEVPHNEATNTRVRLAFDKWTKDDKHVRVLQAKPATNANKCPKNVNLASLLVGQRAVGFCKPATTRKPVRTIVVLDRPAHRLYAALADRLGVKPGDVQLDELVRTLHSSSSVVEDAEQFLKRVGGEQARFLCGVQPDCDKDSDNNLQRALDNVKRADAVVFADRVDDSAQQLEYFLPSIVPKRLKALGGAKEAQELLAMPADVKRILKLWAHADVAVYQAARQRFAQLQLQAKQCGE